MIAHKGILDPTSSNLRTFSTRPGWLYVHVMSSIPVLPFSSTICRFMQQTLAHDNQIRSSHLSTTGNKEVEIRRNLSLLLYVRDLGGGGAGISSHHEEWKKLEECQSKTTSIPMI